jgi:hypothetical protein
VGVEDLPRIRLGPVRSTDYLVVRGGELDLALSKADAARFYRRYPRWGRYGVSAFVGTDDEEVDVICETRLERFETVVVFERWALDAAGIEIVPTFRRPHVTLAQADLDVLVDGLRSCERRLLANRHYGGLGDVRR